MANRNIFSSWIFVSWITIAGMGLPAVIVAQEKTDGPAVDEFPAPRSPQPDFRPSSPRAAKWGTATRNLAPSNGIRVNAGGAQQAAHSQPADPNARQSQTKFDPNARQARATVDPNARQAQHTVDPNARPAQPAFDPNARPINSNGQPLVEKAYELTKTANTDEAFTEVIELCKEAMEKGLSDKSTVYARRLQAWAYNRRGESRADAGPVKDAFDDFDAAVTLDNRGWRAIHNRGVCYAMLGNQTGAIADFTKAIELNPKFANAWFNRGEMQYEKRNFAAAVADYTEVLKLAPRDAAALNSRGHANYRLRKFNEALADYNQALEVDPSSAAAFVNRGDLYSEQGNFSQAAKDYRAAIKANLQLGRAYQSAAWLMATCPDEKFRDADLALEAAQKAIELDGDGDYRYLETLAAAQANAGNYEDAIATQERAIETAPPAVAQVYKGRVEKFRGPTAPRTNHESRGRPASNETALIMNPRIVILDGATLNPGDNPWTEIESIGEVAIYDRTPAGSIVERSRAANVLVVNKVKLPADVLEQLPALKLIAVTATGYDCVDVSAAKRLGIAVCNVPIYGTDSVAQHTFALIMHLCHRVDLHDAAVHAGEWTRSPDFCFWKTPLVELAGLTLGVVGYGRIGRRVAELGHAFGMEILANSRHRKNAPEWEPFRWAEIDELFSVADVITLHCPLTPETKGLVNASSLTRFKRTAWLVNTSRGGLIVESDLATSLNRGQIAAAALDVLSAEPPQPDNPLLSAKNCVITPHQAWATLAARQRLMRVTATNIGAFFSGQPQNVVG